MLILHFQLSFQAIFPRAEGTCWGPCGFNTHVLRHVPSAVNQIRCVCTLWMVPKKGCKTCKCKRAGLICTELCIMPWTLCCLEHTIYFAVNVNNSLRELISMDLYICNVILYIFCCFYADLCRQNVQI